MYRVYTYIHTEQGVHNGFNGCITTCVARFGYGAPRQRRPRVIRYHEGGEFVPRKAATTDLKAVKLHVWRDLGTGRRGRRGRICSEEGGYTTFKGCNLNVWRDLNTGRPYRAAPEF